MSILMIAAFTAPRGKPDDGDFGRRHPGARWR